MTPLIARLLVLKAGYGLYRLAQNNWDPLKAGPVIARDLQKAATSAGNNLKKGFDYVSEQTRIIAALRTIKYSEDPHEIANTLATILPTVDQNTTISSELESIARNRAHLIAKQGLIQALASEASQEMLYEAYVALYLLGAMGMQLEPADAKEIADVLAKAHRKLKRNAPIAQQLTHFQRDNPLILMGLLASEPAILSLQQKSNDPLIGCYIAKALGGSLSQMQPPKSIAAILVLQFATN